jgi:hypothetical protein
MSIYEFWNRKELVAAFIEHLGNNALDQKMSSDPAQSFENKVKRNLKVLRGEQFAGQKP